MDQFKSYSNGKLLLTGEYLVLKGAKALALPVNKGQSLTVIHSGKNGIEWQSFALKKTMFKAHFNLNDFSFSQETSTEKAQYISGILKAIKTLNPDFLKHSKGFLVNAYINFDMHWGLGTSSTLINNLAQWGKVDPFELNKLVSNGSGYDIACAKSDFPIVYKNAPLPSIEKVKLNHELLKKLNLVYLNQKQATEKNIRPFVENPQDFTASIETVNSIAQKWINASSIIEIEHLIHEHEKLIGSIINQIPIKEKYFNNFEGSIKSLGAWGGDFALVVSKLPFAKQKEYFSDKGFHQFFQLKNFLLPNLL
jgi:mevalonate kinase